MMNIAIIRTIIGVDTFKILISSIAIQIKADESIIANLASYFLRYFASINELVNHDIDIGARNNPDIIGLYPSTFCVYKGRYDWIVIITTATINPIILAYTFLLLNMLNGIIGSEAFLSTKINIINDIIASAKHPIRYSFFALSSDAKSSATIDMFKNSIPK